MTAFNLHNFQTYACILIFQVFFELLRGDPRENPRVAKAQSYVWFVDFNALTALERDTIFSEIDMWLLTIEGDRHSTSYTQIYAHIQT